MKDPDRLIKVEKAIEEKYGAAAVQDPKNNWDEEKEKDYRQQIRQLAKDRQEKEKVEIDGVLLPKKLFTKANERSCPVCKEYSFKARDDVYMSKYKCCHRCYIMHVEGREEKWLKKQNQI